MPPRREPGTAQVVPRGGPRPVPWLLPWTVLAACLVCQMGLGLGGYVFAVFLKPIVTEMGWSRTAFAAARYSTSCWAAARGRW